MIREFKVLHLFCGLGGGAIGFQRARAQWRGVEGRFRTLAGIDNNPAAVADFEMFTGAPGIVADLSTMMPADLLRATRGEWPDVVFSSPPCKGFSALLSKSRSKEDYYQKLNELVFQGLFLVMETWPKNPPKLIALENVPRITIRGKDLLERLRKMLGHYGYVFHEGFHDCGELGNLAQSRRRYLLVARHKEQMPTFVYKPVMRALRTIGEVIGPLPMPDDPLCGPMHKMPRLKMKTWDRLARIPAGGDWRSLGVRDDGKTPYNNQFRIVPWDYPSIAVTGGGTPTSGGVNVADPRVESENRSGNFGVKRFDEPMGTITGESMPSGGAFSVADPRVEGEAFRNAYGVKSFDEPSGVITGDARPSKGAFSVADPRPAAGTNWHPNAYRIVPWTEPMGTVTGSGKPSSGAFTIADPRPGFDPRLESSPGVFGNHYRVNEWDKAAPTVTSASRPVEGAIVVADPRMSPNPGRHYNKFRVERWDGAAHAVTGSDRVGSGAPSIADPRVVLTPALAEARNGNWAGRPGYMGVLEWDKHAPAVTGAASVSGSNCPAAIADPRIPRDEDLVPVPEIRIPGPEERPDPPPLIIALDGTWHRPLTTFELAAIQSLPLFDKNGQPLQLDGKSHTAWRERIGNAVPPDAAEAMGSAFLVPLIQAIEGTTFVLSGGGEVWVRRDHLLML